MSGRVAPLYLPCFRYFSSSFRDQVKAPSSRWPVIVASRWMSRGFLGLGSCKWDLALARIWRTRCRDAVELLHTASSLLQQYGGMDATKTFEYKASFNETISRVLDNKLPTVISRACVGGRSSTLQAPNFTDTKPSQIQMDDFYTNPALLWSYVPFCVCHVAFVLIMNMKIYTRWWKTHAARIVSPGFETGNHYAFVDVALQDSIACGLTIGYDIAALVNVLLQISYFTSSKFDDFDSFDLITMMGLLFSLLLVIGALASASWPSDLGIVFNVSVIVSHGLSANVMLPDVDEESVPLHRTSWVLLSVPPYLPIRAPI
ncbi:MAG: hypothetical protein L6R42_001826 [Xanthoria sp. 1 TBL-2021]|nr:MAG: hypothetical protein L6R42_001826 [Xanthoria sp. 1 TBL-2021]